VQLRKSLRISDNPHGVSIIQKLISGIGKGSPPVRPTRNTDRTKIALDALESTTIRVSPAWRKECRSNELICYINVTGFVSVMLVLLVVTFMSTNLKCLCRPVGYDLAKVDSPVSMRGADREDALLVGIGRDGKVFFASDLVRPSDLPPRIRESVGPRLRKEGLHQSRCAC
jgi:biopolymer transport protein ExbD